jgi:ABC-2 type transport system permease protein
MARLLVQLKLRLLRNALRSSTGAKASFLTSTIFAVLVAAGVFVVLALLRGQSASVDVTSVIFTLFAFGWLILPVFVFGLDSTLDPATLSLYPLRVRPLAVGLLAASATGAWPLANVIGLLGVTVGLARGPAGLVIAVVTTSMAGLLRSRRGKDFAVLLIIPIFALYELFAQTVGTFTAASFDGIDAWLRWLPPGLAAHAIQDASDGHAGTALLRLVLLAAITVVLGGLWIRSLGRALVTADSSTQSAQVRGATLPLGRFGLGGAVTARFWIYQRREPTSLLYWGATLVVMGALSLRAVLGPNGHPAFILASAIAGAGFIGYFHANTAGLTGPPFVLEAMALNSRGKVQAYFAGQDIALGVIAVPLLTAASFGLAAVAGKPGYGFLGTAVGLAALGAALALSNIFTVALPFPMDKRAGSPFRQAASGFRAHQFVGMLAIICGTVVAVIPMIVAVLHTGTDSPAVRMPVLVVCGAAYGLALAWGGVRIAAIGAEPRLPELSQIAIRSPL